MGGSWATRPVKRRQASGGDEIETTRVQSKGQRRRDLGDEIWGAIWGWGSGPMALLDLGMLIGDGFEQDGGAEIHGLPIEYMSKENVEEIGVLVGKVVEVDFIGDGKICMSQFLRVKVDFEVAKPLKSGFYLDRSSFPELWVRFTYERIADFCYKCSRLGHLKAKYKLGGRPVAESFSRGPQLVIEENGIIDMMFSGNPFTWSNKREGLANIKERLDRAFANDRWRFLFPRATGWLRREEILWKNKSRNKWLTTTDLNAKYFHLSTIIRRKRNAIAFLKNQQGRWILGRVEIGQSFVDYFINLFSTSNTPIPNNLENLISPSLSEEEVEMLACMPSVEEIKDVVFSLGSHKAPSLDGMSAHFYKCYWNFIGGEIVEAVNIFFSKGYILKEINHTFIALIPKAKICLKLYKRRLANLVGINASNKKEKYIGLPLVSSREKKAATEEIIEKVKQRLQAMKKKHGLYLKSWDSICTPKALGDLGIKKTEDMDRALVAKLTWEVASDAEKPWVKMFQKKYVRGKNFMKMPMPKSIYWSSQSIFGYRDVVKKGLCHKIGSGWNTWIFDDHWVPEELDFTPKVKSEVILSEHLLANLIDQDSRQWDRAIVGRDYKGDLIFAWAEQVEPGSPLVGEVKAALCAIKRAIENGFSKIIVEGDALSNTGMKPHWSVAEVITDILDFVKCFDAISFSFMYRESNVLAYLLA
ncbi:hypothetical protein SO802_001636 [Lithocarpus litseifolius]|uniref:Reverse transcriptase n=1 Tax=Lithocarpus litseifolius TaxID=425828 RepID=A0AAW2DXQ1_9ROSI